MDEATHDVTSGVTSGVTSEATRGVTHGNRRLEACPVCGMRLAGDLLACPNEWCGRPDRWFSVAFSLGTHSGALRHALLRYKYKRELWWADVFAGDVARFLRTNETWFEEFDLITGVPAYTGPGSRRGWDPVGTILEKLEPMVRDEWEVAGDVLAKTAETRPMQRLSRDNRRALATGPLRRSLTVRRPGSVDGARVLVFDDVMTGGSTLREVARVLRVSGAEEVAGLVLARLPWVNRPPV